jgi:hypothetical protein
VKMPDIYGGFSKRFLILINRQRGNKLAQPNFQYEKRQKELAKKKKQEEKKQRKLDEKNQSEEVPAERPDDGSTPS